MDISYKFWESTEDRAKRLEGMWLETKKQRDAREMSEAQLYVLYNDVVNKLRAVRWKMDQMLEREGVDPIFKEHYLTYSRKEFLVDSEVNFRKIKIMLQRMPNDLKNDEEVGPYFQEIAKLIQKVAVYENTTPGYYDSDGSFHFATQMGSRKWKQEKDFGIDYDGGSGIVDDFMEDEVNEEAAVEPKGDSNDLEKKLKLIGELRRLATGDSKKDKKQPGKKKGQQDKEAKSALKRLPGKPVKNAPISKVAAPKRK